MASIPIYQQSVQGEDQQTPQARIEPLPQVAAPTNIGEAVTGLGKTTEQFGTELEKIGIRRDKLNAQTQGYKAASNYREGQLKQLQEQVQNMNGLDAQGAEDMVRAKLKGSPAIAPGWTTAPGQNLLNLPSQATPGKPEVAPLSAQYSNGLSMRAIPYFNRVTETYENSLINFAHAHEVSQVQGAWEAHAHETMNSQIALGNQILTPDMMQSQQSAIGKIFDDSEYYKLQFKGDQDAMNFAKQGFLDAQTKNAVEAMAPKDYKQAQALLDASSASPQVKTQLKQTMIKGGELQQTTDGFFAHATTSNSKLLLSNGALDMSKVENSPNGIKSLPNIADFTPEEQDTLLKNIQTKENEANKNLKDANEAQTQTFFSKIKPGTSVDQGTALAGQYAARLRNGAVDQNDLREKLNHIGIMNQPLKGSTDAETYVSLLRGVDNGTIDTIGPIQDAFKAGYISKSNYESMAKTLYAGRSDAMTTKRNELSKNLEDDIPDKTDREQFIANVRDQENQLQITKPTDLADLWNKNLESAKTGATRVFGMLSKNEPYWQLAKSVGSNPEVIQYVQNHGGPDSFKVGTPQNNALESLVKIQGFKSDQITPDIVEKYLKKYPNGKP